MQSFFSKMFLLWFSSSQVDWMQLQLEQEVSLRRQLERVNEELKDQLASVKSTSYKKEQLDMRKQQLDGEVLNVWVCLWKFFWNLSNLFEFIVLFCNVCMSNKNSISGGAVPPWCWGEGPPRVTSQTRSGQPLPTGRKPFNVWALSLWERKSVRVRMKWKVKHILSKWCCFSVPGCVTRSPGTEESQQRSQPALPAGAEDCRVGGWTEASPWLPSLHSHGAREIPKALHRRAAAPQISEWPPREVRSDYCSVYWSRVEIFSLWFSHSIFIPTYLLS